MYEFTLGANWKVSNHAMSFEQTLFESFSPLHSIASIHGRQPGQKVG